MVVGATFCGLEHAIEFVRCVGFLLRKKDLVVLFAIDDVQGVFFSQVKDILMMLLHFTHSLLSLANYFINLNKKKSTGT